MKQIAILEYEILFDPSETWSNGYQFENQLADFFSAYGFEAQIIEARGGSGKRVIFLSRVEPIKNLPQKISPQVKTSYPVKRLNAPPPLTFKQFSKKVVHDNMQAPDSLSFSKGKGRLRQKVRMP